MNLERRIVDNRTSNRKCSMNARAFETNTANTQSDAERPTIDPDNLPSGERLQSQTLSNFHQALGTSATSKFTLNNIIEGHRPKTTGNGRKKMSNEFKILNRKSP